MGTREKVVLNIPVNLKTKIEFFDGYGVQELLQNVVIGLIGIIVALIFYLIKRNDFMAILIAFIFVAGGFFLTVKDTLTLSLLDQIRIAYRFSKTQKHYKYKSEGGIIDEYYRLLNEQENEKQSTK